MKNLFKYLGLFSLALFSFYYTEKMSNIVVNNSELMLEINMNSDDYEILPVSAIISDEYIIPGLNGYTVNVLKSYNNMKFLDDFNSYYLEYDTILPNVSIYNNLDKIIKYGNKNKQSVSIIVKNNFDVIKYSTEKDINITRLIDKNTFDKNVEFEQINDEYLEYKKVENMLNYNNINKNICIINDDNIDICKKEKKLLVEASIVMNNYNLSNIKNIINGGYIIYVNDNVDLTNYKLLLKQIYYKDLEIVSLSDLIKEERD